eukprot:ANDGO_00803.mRNA.1 RNA polymerase II subunit A C-terminal domain phosphatase
MIPRQTSSQRSPPLRSSVPLAAPYGSSGSASTQLPNVSQGQGSGTALSFAKSPFRAQRIGVRSQLELPRTRKVPSPTNAGSSPTNGMVGSSPTNGGPNFSVTRSSMGAYARPLGRSSTSMLPAHPDHGGSGFQSSSAGTLMVGNSNPNQQQSIERGIDSLSLGSNEIGRPLSYLRERSPLGFLSLVPHTGNDGEVMGANPYEMVYVNCPTKFVLEPDPCHWHETKLAEYRVKQGLQLLKKIGSDPNKKHIVPLLNGFYLVITFDGTATLHKRQLTIVFDLDNTLVHSVETDHPAMYARGSDVHHLIFREPYEHEDSHVVCKVRPGAREVLKALGERFSLYICTMGTKSYVTQALKVLDPDSTIFRHAICREDLPSLPDDPNVLVKDLYRIQVLQDPTWTLVVDDSPDVWIQKGHVLPITKYYYFDEYTCESYRNAVPSLYSARVVLEGIHRQFLFAEKPWECQVLSLLERFHR